MNRTRLISVALLVTAVILGTISDTPRSHAPLVIGGYRVLVADFHIHSFPLSWATLAPWDTVLDARHEGMDAIAMTGHDHVFVAKIGRWFSNMIGGPTVVIGEEITAPNYHLLAIGIHDTIEWNQSAASAIDEIHRQGGVAIAAHPRKKFWRSYDDAALNKLDGAEIQHPLVYATPNGYPELQTFYARGHFTAIGDSDYHGIGPIGICRTYVFARENSAPAILEALREGHTVVLDGDGRAYGDPELIPLAMADPRFVELNASYSWANPGWMARASSLFGVLGLLGVFVSGWK